MTLSGMFPRHPPARSDWYCPQCGRGGTGDADSALGTGLCKGKAPDRHPPQRLVRKPDPEPSRSLRETDQEGA